MIALVAGAILAVAALAFVLAPIFLGVRPTRSRATAAESEEDAASARAVSALREVEFDRATGKLSDADYDALKARYTREALAALRAEEPARAGLGDDELEAVILSYRARTPACAECGPRPEPDAAYCSACGRYLAGRCARCQAPVTEQEARFCSTCGTTLAA